MCGINGIFSIDQRKSEELCNHSSLMNKLLKHRGPDDEGVWTSKKNNNSIVLGHVRLSIIDLSKAAHQPFIADNNDNNVLVFNGEIYNYLELRNQLKDYWSFKTESDTEVILAAYSKYGVNCLDYFEGMFAFALWDVKQQQLFLARDRVGIKPLYYYCDNRTFYFASEVKALLPFISKLEINNIAFTEYLIFQHPLKEDLLFKNIKQLMPGEYLLLDSNNVHNAREINLNVKKYWDIEYKNIHNNFNTAQLDFIDLMQDSMNKHLRSDVKLGCYLSGGIDSSIISILAKQQEPTLSYAINGMFADGIEFDESIYAKKVAEKEAFKLDVLSIDATDFIKNINNIIYHLDYPIAGPGSFPQYMVSEQAAKHAKVMLGGQGGDELFGGYARYLLMYFSEAINNALDGSADGSIDLLSQLKTLKNYKPLFQQIMSDCFATEDRKYFNLINRAVDLTNQEVNWADLPVDIVYERYKNIFNSAKMEQENILNKALHFDFKCSLPGLLHVEDRLSMAHGLESRVPFLDHRIVEFSAGLQPNIKFHNGTMKSFLKECYKNTLPSEIYNRYDKMGFPVPLNQWATGELKDFLIDIFSTQQANSRGIINYKILLNSLKANKTNGFSRKLWGMVSLELWFQTFYDQHQSYKSLLQKSAANAQNTLSSI